MKKILKITLTISAFLIFFQGCNMDENKETAENPVPKLNSLSPNSKVAHMPGFTLTARGSNFVSTSVIVFNGTEKQTVYVSASELTCLLESTAISAATLSTTDLSGALSKQLPVLVRTPSPGGGDSDTLDFTVNDNHTFYVARTISGTTFTPESSAIAVDSAGNMNVVWYENGAGNDEIFFTRSIDNGVTWSQAVNISGNNGSSKFPEIAIYGSSNINVVWNDNTPGKNDIFFIRSTDSGATWSQIINISNNADDSYQPIAVVDNSGNIAVAWYDYTPGDSDILFSRSTDSGSSWSQAVNISNTQATSARVDMVVGATGKIAVAWHEIISGYWQVLFSRSTDNGTSWAQPKKISYLWGNSYHPVLAADSSGNLNIAWENDNFNNLFFSRSGDNGATWSQGKNISGNLQVSYGYAITADSAGNINFSWSNGTTGNTDIFFIRSIDNGTNWSQAIDISNIIGESMWPEMAVDHAGNINAIWKNGSHLYYTGSTR